MKLTIIIIIAIFAIATFASEPNSSKILWNDESPCSFAERPEDVQLLADELTEKMDQGFKEMLKWHGGQRIVDPNDELKQEIAVMEKVLYEVFKPGILPLDSIKEHLLQTNITTLGKQERVLMVRFKAGDYVVKLVKRKYSLRVVTRLRSGEAISSENLAKSFFTERVLPYSWESPFYTAKLKRTYNTIRIGGWSPRDVRYYDSSGNFHTAWEGMARPQVELLGNGLYGRVDFCTDGKFTIFSISGGPKKQDANSIP